MSAPVEHHAQQGGNTGTQRRQQDGFARRQHGELGNKGHMETLGMDAHIGRKPGGDQGRKDAGHQAHVIHDAHAGNLQRKDSCGHGRAEDGGKGGTHAAQDHHAAILIVHLHKPPQQIAQTSAQLQGRTLTAGRATEQMGQQGGTKDQRCHHPGQILPGVDGGQHQIGASVLPQNPTVQKHDEQTCRRQAENQPTVVGAQGGDLPQQQGKQAADQSHGTAGDGGDQHPFEK